MEGDVGDPMFCCCPLLRHGDVLQVSGKLRKVCTREVALDTHAGDQTIFVSMFSVTGVTGPRAVGEPRATVGGLSLRDFHFNVSNFKIT